MQKILITAFEPFDKENINASQEAIQSLHKKKWKEAGLITLSIPVVRYKSIEMVTAAIKEHKPDIVITTGQAAGRTAITPERVAINIDDFRVPDNQKNQPIDEAIIPQAPLAYFSTLPIKAMVMAMQKKGIPSFVSNSAGTFICNHLFYGVQHYIAKNKLAIRHGFIHVPVLPKQSVNGEKPTMSKVTIVKGLAIAIQAVLDYPKDIVQSGGTIC